MPYERTEVSAQEIERQKEICARVRARLGERFALTPVPERGSAPAERYLVDGGYRLEKVEVVDQFLWSHHVEAVAVLRRAA